MLRVCRARNVATRSRPILADKHIIIKRIASSVSTTLVLRCSAAFALQAMLS
jgi:hypothetical protein